MNNKWNLIIPKQPKTGIWCHKNDSWREIPLLLKLKNKDVDIQFKDNTNHCWIEPNILLYDRPTLQWVNNEIFNSSLIMLGNGSIYKEGNDLRTDTPALKYEGDEKDILVKNFFIKTAYNCCNAGGYKNNWVNICAMTYALKLGARCLDFEIYSIENMPVVASSINTNF